MRTSTSISLVTTLIVLFGFLQLASAVGDGTLRHWCTFDVWCAVVKGYTSETPSSARESANWKKLNAGSDFVTSFDYAGNDGTVGVAMM